MLRWSEELRHLELDEIGDRYARYRLYMPEAERAMVRSLSRYGQISPVVACEQKGVYELIDGFKRWAAARQLKPIPKLSCRLIEVDERGAKAAIYGLNRVGGRTRELEEAWIVHALVREDALSQVEVAELLGRHKSWVCRRLALIEKLVPEAREQLRLGLLCPSAARQLIRLPVGNQKELLPVIRREALSVDELNRVVDLLLRSSERNQQTYVLQQPREALAQDEHLPLPAQDPRLSAAANLVFKRLGSLNAQMSRMDNWLQHYGRAELTPRDQTLLCPHFDRLSRQATRLAALCQDVLSEMEKNA
ncbi:MAG: ParB N-terminal domain-containing protein [bacterium]|nr:ParB N-terminal domain-containing protein [bacterium]